ncbi:MAG TPA: NAD(P)-dependent oxidoreductase [Burkholderiaceae bacterium]|nr:NAD(P)-dependent oxidoreductase [Burkholderiaceae bacterium]
MKIGFCGLGLMGAPMVRRLLEAGHDVMVWNRTASRADEARKLGARVAETPAALADECQHVIICLFDAPAAEAVVFGQDGLAHGKALTHILDHSTLPVDKTREFAERLHDACAAAWVDAPVSGGVAGAEQGTLAIMAGGSEDDLQIFRPALAAYSSRVTLMGKVGSGQATKLCNQTIVTAGVAAIAEAITLAEDNGVDASRLHEALAGGWADSVLLQVFVPRMTSDEPVLSATVGTMLKDLNTIAGLAQTHNTAMPVSAATQQLFRHAVARGLEQDDVSRIIQVYRKS